MGRGHPRSRGRGRHHGTSTRSRAPDPVAEALQFAASAALVAQLEALPDMVSRDYVNAAAPQANPGVEAAEAVSFRLVDWRGLRDLLAWFREVLDTEPTAELHLSPLLAKAHRQQVHALAESVGLGTLATTSQGVGPARHIVIHKTGEGPPPLVLTEAQQHKALWLWRWVRDQGVSRDEMAEMIATQQAPDDLETIWAEKSSEQKDVSALCAAVWDGDLQKVQGVLRSHPHSLRSGLFDVQTGAAPLHMAAVKGDVAVLTALLQAGANVEGLDGDGLTPLQVARKAEQCDAEGLLLQAGAKDDEAASWPVSSATAPIEEALAHSQPPENSSTTKHVEPNFESKPAEALLDPRPQDT